MLDQQRTHGPIIPQNGIALLDGITPAARLFHRQPFVHRGGSPLEKRAPASKRYPMWTEDQAYGLLEQYGVTVTDAIREEISQDQTDPSKWIVAPAHPSEWVDLFEPTTRPHDESAGAKPRALQLKPGVTAEQIRERRNPQLRAQQDYLMEFIRLHVDPKRANISDSASGATSSSILLADFLDIISDAGITLTETLREEIRRDLCDLSNWEPWDKLTPLNRRSSAESDAAHAEIFPGPPGAWTSIIPVPPASPQQMVLRKEYVENFIRRHRT